MHKHIKQIDGETILNDALHLNHRHISANSKPIKIYNTCKIIPSCKHDFNVLEAQ